MRRVVVINVVGLSERLIGPATPNIAALAEVGGMRPIAAVTPAVTCSAQATYLTGLRPSDHGIVGNGWYFRDLSEVLFWRQSNRLIRGRQIWELARARDPGFTGANLFWWYNMYSGADIGVTPRPMYPADGRKIPDCYAKPQSLRDTLTQELGPFPLFKFWGPGADIRSSTWITEASLRVQETADPTLTLVYLPHLDYVLQKESPDGPSVPQNLREVDRLCGRLIDAARARNAHVILLSEYAVLPVTGPVHINRVLREHGYIQYREELGREVLDPGASAAFAIADHQIAHLYVRDPEDLSAVRALVDGTPGVDRVLDGAGKAQIGLDHDRAGDLVALAAPDRWFTYYYWLDDERCPDYARTVDIHRKPGYDPVELFIDPAFRFSKLAVGTRLIRRKLGFRTLLDVIPLDATLVKGSHGRVMGGTGDRPVILSSAGWEGAANEAVDATAVLGLILAHLDDTA